MEINDYFFKNSELFEQFGWWVETSPNSVSLSLLHTASFWTSLLQAVENTRKTVWIGLIRAADRCSSSLAPSRNHHHCHGILKENRRRGSHISEGKLSLSNSWCHAGELPLWLHCSSPPFSVCIPLTSSSSSSLHSSMFLYGWWHEGKKRHSVSRYRLFKPARRSWGHSSARLNLTSPCCCDVVMCHW